MTRYFALALTILLSAYTVCAQSSASCFELDKPLVFDGVEYHLAFSSKSGDGFYMQEYLPQGQTFDNYTSMITISLHKGNITPKQAVMAKAAELDERKKSDIICNYQVMERDHERMIDFLVSDAPTGNFNTVEFDVHRYQSTNIDHTKYLLLFFYSERAYGESMTDYLKSLRDHRIEILNKVGNYAIPSIRLID